jgi:serine/threonine-protein kinase
MVSVVGLYNTAATAELDKAGFTNYRIETQNSDDVENGYVISQSVEEGTEIPVDEEIIIYVSAGKNTTTVPDVSNLTDEQATTMLQEKNLKITHSYEFSDTVEKDRVIATDPAANTEVPEGTEVTVIISNGKEVKTTEVPNLVGESNASAESLLSNAGLKGNPSYAYDDNVAQGYVISQETSAGSSVSEGSTVNYVISQGPETVTYSASFSGTISNNGYDFSAGNVSVTVTYTVDGATYTLYSGAAGESSFPIDISQTAASLTGLSSNSGSFAVNITDVNGADVSSSFGTGGLSATFSKE